MYMKRLEHARDCHDLPFGGFPDPWSVWANVPYQDDVCFLRALYPEYDQRSPTVSDLSEATLPQLENEDQPEYLYSGGIAIFESQNGGGNVVSDVSCHPIEASINSLLYSWGSWFRPDCEMTDVSDEAEELKEVGE